MAKMSKGVIVEFDFTVLNGAEILFNTAKKLLKGAGVELNTRFEALHLAGGNYQGGLAELFEATGRSGDAAALARELNTAFNSAVAAKAADAVTPAFKNFLKALADHGATPIDSLGEPFDANYHEALAQLPSPDVAEGVVMNEVKRGWLLHGKLLRAAQVVVSSGAPEKPAEA